jgi:hypothetical protein
MGVAQGRAFADRIFSGRKLLLHLEAFRLQQPRWMPYPVFRFIAERKARSFMEPALTDHADFLQRLNGIQSGSGASFGNLCLLNSLETALSSLGDCTVSLGGCSAMAVRGSRSATGEPMIAKNFDYLPLVQPLYSLRKSEPTVGKRALEFTAAPLVGTIDGVNESGLAITYNYAFTTDMQRAPAAPISVVIAEALRDCSTVAEAAQFIDSTPRCGGGILMLADTTGDIASMEVSNTRTEIRRPPAGADVISHANCFRTDAMQGVQLPMDTVYTDRAPTPLRGRTLHNSSNLRDARFAELLDGDRALNVDDLSRIMGDHGEPNEPSDYTLCVHGSYWQTTASLQLLPTQRRIRVAYSNTCEADYVAFDLG